MTPKSLLRHKLAVSTAAEMTTGSSFHRVLWDDAERGNSQLRLKPDSEIRRVVLCSGKVYYDLLEERDARGSTTSTSCGWSSSTRSRPEPRQGAVALQGRRGGLVPGGAQEPGRLDLHRAQHRMGPRPDRGDPQAARYVGRPASASPATGLASSHKAQQQALVDEALTVEGN
jgi:2-oxoglutarate dehydrogenase E1 component